MSDPLIPIPRTRRTAALVAARGAVADVGVARRVASCALACASSFDPVREAFLDHEPFLRLAVASTEADLVVVIPFVEAAGSSDDEAIRRALSDVGPSVRIAAAVGDHALLAEAIAQRAQAAAAGTGIASRRAAVLVVVEDASAALATAGTHADRIRAMDAFEEVAPSTIQDLPTVLGEVSCPDIICVPFTASGGQPTRDAIGAACGLAPGMRTSRRAGRSVTLADSAFGDANAVEAAIACARDAVRANGRRT